jgi:hypothetical protein
MRRVIFGENAMIRHGCDFGCRTRRRLGKDLFQGRGTAFALRGQGENLGELPHDCISHTVRLVDYGKILRDHNSGSGSVALNSWAERYQPREPICIGGSVRRFAGNACQVGLV